MQISRLRFGVILFAAILGTSIGNTIGNHYLFKKSPCLETLATSTILKVTPQTDQSLTLDLLVEGSTQIQKATVASTSEAKGEYKTGKSLKFCSLVE